MATDRVEVLWLLHVAHEVADWTQSQVIPSKFTFAPEIQNLMEASKARRPALCTILEVDKLRERVLAKTPKFPPEYLTTWYMYPAWTVAAVLFGLGGNDPSKITDPNQPNKPLLHQNIEGLRSAGQMFILDKSGFSLVDHVAHSSGERNHRASLPHGEILQTLVEHGANRYKRIYNVLNP